MKRKNLKSLKLNKKSISTLENFIGGLRAPLDSNQGSQHDSKCGYSCTPALC
ncbi:hypothetical protein [uncultured Kordia sp.]|uniref:hypothetical protein n=1 Tax=uncultured Kordia sp. TaxID=507699 RepID=UPI00262C7BA3|nr:hypothetical protein [uncultured Kordia sp.]